MSHDLHNARCFLITVSPKCSEAEYEVVKYLLEQYATAGLEKCVKILNNVIDGPPANLIQLKKVKFKRLNTQCTVSDPGNQGDKENNAAAALFC